MTDDEVLASLRPPEDQAAPVPGMDAPPAPGYVQGSSPVAPNPAAAFEAPMEGPPAPSPTDAIAATMPPPVPGGPTEDPAGQLAPAVPREAPGMVPPGGAPAALAATPGPNDKGTGSVEGALSDVEAARKDSDEAKLEQYKGQQIEKQSQDQARADFATKRREELEARQKEDDARAQLDKAADAKAQANLAASDAAIKNFKFKDLWADKTGAEKVGSALGVALLAIGAGMMKTPKYAIEILDKEMADDHQKQLDHLHLLQDDFVRQRTGMQDATLGRKKMEADIQLGRARKDELIASRFEEIAAKSKDQNAAQDAVAFATKLKQDSAQARLQSLETLRSFHLADEKSQLDEQLKKSQISENESLAAMHGRTHAKGAGGGAGGGGGRAAALADFAEAAGKLAPGDPIPREVVELGAKAGLKGNQVATEADKYRGSGAKSERQKKLLGLMDEKDPLAVEERRELYSDKGPQHQLERINSMTSELKGAITSGDRTAATRVLEEAGGMLSGGKSTKTTVELIEKLKSAGDELSSKWGHFMGNPGDSKEFTGRLQKLLEGAAEEKRSQADAIIARYDGLRQHGGVPQASGAPKAPQGKRLKLKDGRTGTLDADGMFHQDA